MKNKIAIFHIVILVLGSLSIRANTNYSNLASLQITIDTASTLQPISFDKDKLSEYKKSKDFDYTEIEMEATWWTQFKHWIQEWWHKLLNTVFDIGEVSDTWALILAILPYIVLLFILALIIWLFVKGKVGRILEKKDALENVVLEDDQEIIKNKNIDQLIENARTAGNYRLAIRYHYLMIIKLLANSQSITLAAQKTNADYLLEIKSLPLQVGFEELTQLYNFIWYGFFAIDTISYSQFETKFLQFRNHITSITP
ncbi:hypothetical protein ACE939_08670 [Aquimarina sp. W85]|uniref:hypothetical protein n=1 Tax=Aquimarina rhodophyticola TaxID=3342246 RepID=UPI00366A6FD3